ncbi:MAG: extracellular solute-binding protein [Mesorhizobium sp.]|uniref:ABC transporter substrate-binding protein n=1 Tax=Mesorhizobium sp. TaxID=1871066 RepID=UPI000FE8D87C|nr:extracellular solute-binding protein [Mesorhizobium sp.]RWO23572.1 MAG: extracellular solute-binding protein [Mesorhizobium sp.]
MPHNILKMIAAGLAAYAIVSSSGAQAQTELSFPSYAWTEKVDGTYLAGLSDDFEKANPGVKVSRIPVAFRDMANKLFLDVTSGHAPDFVTLFDPEVRNYIDRDLLEPLDSYLARTGIRADEFAEPGRLAMKDSHVYAITISINPQALLYNSEIFNKLSLEVPRTEKEFLDAARKIKASGLVPFPIAMYAKPGSDDTLYYAFTAILRAFDASILRDGKPTANDPRVVRALHFYKQLYDEGLIPRGMENMLGIKMFAQGKAAMIISGSFIAAIVKDTDSEVYKSLRSVPLHFEGNTAPSVSVFVGVPKQAPNKDLAAQMLMLMLTDKWQEKVVTDVAAMPALKGIMPADFVRENPWFSAFAEVGPIAQSNAPDCPGKIAPEVVKATARKVEAMLFGGLSPEQAASELQQDLLGLMQ